jgi:serine phosphatase RsbU (regulator of sigma subunit)
MEAVASRPEEASEDSTVPEEIPNPAQPPATQDDIQRLRRAVLELSTLNDLALEISASHDFRHITSAIVHRSIRAVRAEQGVITLVDRSSDTDMRTLVRTMAGARTGQALHVDESLLGWMQINKRPLLINAPREDPRFEGVRWGATVRSLLCVPLLVKSELTGVLTVFNKRGADGFSDDDQRLLSIVASQSAQVVENARLREDEETLRRMREELRLASEIQLGLLPKCAPVLPGYDIAGVSVPAEEVGGDYFDFIPVDERRLALCLGDVSGKGLSAALLMSNLQATVRAQTLLGIPPGDCLGHSNTLLARTTEPNKFATCFYAVLDSELHEIRYSNAGHEPPFLLARSGRTARLDKGGVVLGFLDAARYEEAITRLDPGDLLAIYSDGVTDAANEDDEPFGEERLRAVLESAGNASAQNALETILNTVRAHAGARGPQDDMTLVLVRRNAS